MTKVYIEVGHNLKTLPQLDDVDPNLTPTDNQQLVYDLATKTFKAETVTSSSTLTSLGDTTIASPAVGQNLIHDGTDWKNSDALYFNKSLYKQGAILSGTAVDNHVNLGGGTLSETGLSGQSYDYATVGGGFDNVNRHAYGTIAGGKSNKCYIGSTGGTVAGGQSNFVKSNFGFIGGGSSNITTSGAYTAVVGGTSNQSIGIYSAVGGGLSNKANGQQGAVPGGKGNDAGHLSSVAMGGGAKTRANYDIVLGATDTVTADVANNTIRFQGTGGNIKIDGAVSSPEADYAEMFEWYDQNTANESRVGHFVSLHHGKVVKGDGREVKSGISNSLSNLFQPGNSKASNRMVGIVSANPSILGDSAPNHWSGRHLRDKFGVKLMTSYKFYEWFNNDEHFSVYESSDGTYYSEYPQWSHNGILTDLVVPRYTSSQTITAPLINPDYDYAKVYIPREDRQEWVAVGMLGKLIVHSAEPITSDWVYPTKDGRAINGTKDGGYQVIEIIDNYTVKVLFK